MAFGALGKLVRGLTRTRDELASRLRSVFRSDRVLDAATIEELESTLLGADLGPSVVEDLLTAVRGAASRGTSAEEAVRAALRTCLGAGAVGIVQPSGPPRVVFVVGVNGGGKTTTVGKLAARERTAGRKVLVVAADTFRAAAIDQLERWCERAEVDIVRQREGSDPAAVVFDALRAAKAREVDVVLVDTAGRLHTKSHLMAELGKLRRVADREVTGAPHEVLLVVDATTGQNGLAQAEEFGRATPLTGVVLTKLDGTARGGIALAICAKLGVPIRYVGVGEAIDDLLEFDSEAYLEGLLGQPTVANEG